ncbi:hypothetical protein ACIA8O_11840 [Kitasatospora sp. NPDC051853]|uniref:hypothetical protein n=1 Tax=Kitasatospora sp. NPDC051853 TaxID=3364058 RepID=UPI0037A8C896
MNLTVPKRVICAPVQPVPLDDLRLTVPPVLVRGHLLAFERMTPEQREAARNFHLADTETRWRKIIEFELQREADDRRRRRRAALFAAEMDLPDPLHWLDEITTGEPHTLTGKRVA